MINLHLYPSNFKSDTRIEKQAMSIDKLNIFSEIILLGLCNNGPTKNEWFVGDRIKIKLLGNQSKLKGIFGKLLTFFSYYREILKFGMKNDIGCINAHSLSVLPVSWLLRLICRAKLIYDTHELETETNSIGSRKFISKLVERTFIYKADHIFVVGDKIAEWYASAYGIKKPTVIFNTPFSSSITKTNYFREKLVFDNDQRVCLYLGSLSGGRGIEFLCNAFSSFKDDDFVIVFMGDGNLKNYVLEFTKISDNIFYHEPVPAHDVVKVSASADMGLSLVEDTCLSHFYSMPNKVFEYLFAGLPVVVSNMAETALLVQKYDVGEVLADPTPQTLRASLLAVDAARNYNHRMKSLIRGMCWQRQEEKMLSVYENLFQDSNI